MGGVFALDLYLENGSACSGWINDLCGFGLIAGTVGSLVSDPCNRAGNGSKVLAC